MGSASREGCLLKQEWREGLRVDNGNELAVQQQAPPICRWRQEIRDPPGPLRGSRPSAPVPPERLPIQSGGRLRSAPRRPQVPRAAFRAGAESGAGPAREARSHGRGPRAGAPGSRRRWARRTGRGRAAVVPGGRRGSAWITAAAGSRAEARLGGGAAAPREAPGSRPAEAPAGVGPRACTGSGSVAPARPAGVGPAAHAPPPAARPLRRPPLGLGRQTQPLRTL